MSHPYTSNTKLEDQFYAKKRKRDQKPEVLEFDTRPFCIRPTSNEPFAKARTLKPVCLLERAQLPLAYLDTAGSGSRLFTSEIEVLEWAHELENHGKLLIAEEKEDGRLYAIERVAKKVYALCKLGAWVTKATLEQLADVFATQDERPSKRQALASAGGAQWWMRAAVSAISKNTGHKADKALLPNLLVRSNTLDSQQRAVTVNSAQSPVLEPRTDTENQTLESGPIRAQNALEELSKQYLDALYLSRTSLAYFAKGPLSRARAAFAGAIDSGMHSSALATFLRDAILTGPVMEKKYKDGIKNHIEDLPLCSPEEQAKTAKTRRKKKWKAKRDKLGFFSNETDYVAKWWRDGDADPNSSSPETMDLALKCRSPLLRTRETYLQIILALETLAVEANIKHDGGAIPDIAAASESQNAGMEKTLDSHVIADGKKPKPKKQQDLPIHLETLLERLCIWQSITFSPIKQTTEASSDEPGDELRNFCIEVIIPFYSSRLPEHAAAVNRKLGGPSPPTPQSSRTSKSSACSKPGDPAPRQPRKPLSRVPTESNALSRSSKPLIPALNRSATDPNALRSVKREPSELSSLAPISPAQAPRKRDRNALLRVTSGVFREVDQEAQARAAAARLRKREEQDSQVQEAIRMTTKPNRLLASEETAKRADAEHAKNRLKPGRSTKPPAPRALAQEAKVTDSVHVAATPRRPRAPAPVVRTSSHGTVIPSSSARLKAPPLVHHAESTPAIPQTSMSMQSEYDRAQASRGAGVQDTPSRPRTAMMPTAGGGLCESPIASRRSATIAATPVKSTGSFSAGIGKLSSRENVQVEATPVKRGGGLFHENWNQNVVREKTIYGWDEEYEELA